jgi:hypothetical protein
LILGTNKQPFEPKLTNMHNGNLHSLLSVLHRSDRWPAPVRLVTPGRPVDRAGQAGGYSSRITNVPGSLSDFSRPYNRNTPKTQPARKKNPSQSQAKHFQNSQELTAPTRPKDPRVKQITRVKFPQRDHTGQTDQEHLSDRWCLGSSG